MNLYVLKHYSISDRYFASLNILSVVWGACGSFQPISYQECLDMGLVPGKLPLITEEEAWNLIAE